MKQVAVFLFLLLLLLAFPIPSQAGEAGGSFGFGIRMMNEEDFVAVDIPFNNLMVPLYGDYLHMTLGFNILWGMTEFFIDPSLAVGLQYYPVGKYVSLHGTGQFGTWIFTNYSLTAAGGMDIDLPISDEASVFVGGEYFYRRVHRLGEFTDQEQWYLSSNGITIRFGLRFHK